MPWDEYYEQIRHYMPEDAKAALSREIPKIESAIDRRVGEWAKGVGEFIDKEVLTALKEDEEQMTRTREKLRTQLMTLAAATPETEELQKTADKLLKAIAAYEKKWRTVGETVREKVKTAAGSLGIPLP